MQDPPDVFRASDGRFKGGTVPVGAQQGRGALVWASEASAVPGVWVGLGRAVRLQVAAVGLAALAGRGRVGQPSRGGR